jgi:hypothetical protein
MRRFFAIILLVFFSINTAAVMAQPSADTQLLRLSREVLQAIKTRNYTRLATFVHPEQGVLFSPYTFIDKQEARRFTKAQLQVQSKSPKRIRWGTEDPTEEPILLSFKQYMARYVYDADFLNAPQQAANKVIHSGNTLNNIEAVFPGCTFTEFHFPGFKKEFEGMDWRSLRLVFKVFKGKPMLVSIVHDAWSI